MKNFNLIKRLFMDSHEKQSPLRFGRYAAMLIMLLTLGVGQMWADNGWFDDNTWQIRVWPGSGGDIWKGPYSKKNNDNPSWGVITAGSYYIKGVGLNTWGSGVTSTEFYFSLNGKTYGGTVSTGSSSGNYYWENTNLPNPNVDIVSKAANNPGNNTITCYFKYNSGNQFERTITYTLPGFTTTSTSKTIISALSSNKSETISFGNHYGTALTTGNCSITGTHASQFSVTSISETGVTVRFTPSSAGVKNATLTITDAHSKTCTITLTGKSKVLVTYSKGSASGATGSTVTDDKVYGVDLTLKNSGSFSRTGYTQTAWNTNEAGTGGTNYALQATYSTESALALYPTWTAKTTTVTLKPNGATSGSDQTVTATYDAAMPLVTTASAAIALPSKTGYTLLGYWDATSSGTQYYAYGGTPAVLSSYRTWNKEDATKNLYARWQANQYTLTLYKNDGSGTSTSATATYDATITVTAPTRTGYTFTGYWTSASGDGTKIIDTDGHFVNTVVSGYVASGRKWQRTSNTNLYARWTANTYTVTLNKQSGSGGSANVTATYDAAMPSATMPTRTGYNFQGYYGSTGGSGTKYYNANASSAHVWDVANNTTIYAYWTAKQSALTFDYQSSAEGYGADGSISAATATYSAAMPALSGSMPTAANGYAFMGFYDEMGGEGTKYYNADGTSAHDWDKDTESGTTLYAYYKKAEITNLALDAAIVATNSTVGVTPTVSPTPTGTTKLWFYVFHSNDNPLSPQPSITWNGTKATFNSGLTSGTFKIGVALRTGTTYAGTLLDSTTISYQVAGTHTVTIRYKCGDEEIKASTTVGGIQPLVWSSAIEPADIFGYTFSQWEAGDGVTISTNGTSALGSNTTTTRRIYIKANYDGYLTAKYTQKNIIYFKNTLGWSDVYVNLLTGAWWDNTQGTGNQSLASDKSNKQMSLVPGTTDVYYYEYGSTDITNYVSFVDRSMSGKYAFSGTTSDPVRVCYPTIPNPINTKTEMAYFGFYNKTPMFVPASSYPGDLYNNNTAKYYNAGYWTKYTPGTGYYIDIYDPSDDSKLIKRIAFNASNDLIPMTATVQLEASKTYYFDVDREEQTYYSNGNSSMTYANRYGQGTPWEIYRPATYKKTQFTTTAAGDYIFHLTYAGNQPTHTSADVWRLRIAAEYPIANGDYRVIYKDGVHTAFKPSAIVTKANNSRDTVSFFIRPGNASKVLKIQQATVASDGAITWSTGTDVTTSLSGLTKDSVYNICLKMDGSGNISVENVEVYTGKFYIRTDCANSKWDNWKSDPDHLMTYSEYSINHGGYSHYYCHWVKCSETGRKNVKFVIANDYSPCISDTLTRESNAAAPWTNINSYIDSYGNILRDANVRFMWNQHTNTISRAYVDGAQNVGSDNFLYILSTDGKIKWADGTSLTSNKVTFTDNGNWIYEANVKAQPNAAIKLLSNWGTSSPITQYFKGSSSTTEPLIGGSGTGWYDIRVIYDYKTNRLVSAWIPSGNISSETEINADVMFIREHQGDIAQLTFTGSGAIKEIETAYGVLCFNKWTLNNKDKSTHAVLASPKSRYERDLFYVSFPFRVSMEDVFGFGTYGTHWIIEEYDGANRAAKGYWAESAPNWKFVLDRKGKFFEPNQGYIIALELDELGESSSIWDNTEQVELYFPSYGTMPNITNSTVNCTIPEHLCTINRSEEIGGSGLPLGPEYDRRVKDSHWNVISVPTYVNTSNATFANTDWITAGDGHIGPNFLYEWNPDDNTVTARSGVGYTYKAMHAYLVQYCGVITWSSSVSPAAAPRRNPAYRGEYEFRLEILQNDEAVDQTFVKLSDAEAVTTGFEFNYDMSKEFNKSKANIYTLIGTEPAAGNCLPLTDQTTVVPVGVIAKTDGDYTFSIPDGTEGIGVTLIDNETGIRTSLSAVDYTINLSAGTYDDRFLLEISPIKHVATGIETVNEEGVATNGARKIMIDGLLYIVKDGKVFDAQGRQVK